MHVHDPPRKRPMKAGVSSSMNPARTTSRRRARRASPRAPRRASAVGVVREREHGGLDARGLRAPERRASARVEATPTISIRRGLARAPVEERLQVRPVPDTRTATPNPAQRRLCAAPEVRAAGSLGNRPSRSAGPPARVCPRGACATTRRSATRRTSCAGASASDRGGSPRRSCGRPRAEPSPPRR